VQLPYLRGSDLTCEKLAAALSGERNDTQLKVKRGNWMEAAGSVTSPARS
jgi:hypothetical protein